MNKIINLHITIAMTEKVRRVKILYTHMYIYMKKDTADSRLESPS